MSVCFAHDQAARSQPVTQLTYIWGVSGRNEGGKGKRDARSSARNAWLTAVQRAFAIKSGTDVDQERRGWPAAFPIWAGLIRKNMSATVSHSSTPEMPLGPPFHRACVWNAGLPKSPAPRSISAAKPSARSGAGCMDVLINGEERNGARWVGLSILHREARGNCRESVGMRKSRRSVHPERLDNWIHGLGLFHRRALEVVLHTVHIADQFVSSNGIDETRTRRVTYTSCYPRGSMMHGRQTSGRKPRGPSE